MSEEHDASKAPPTKLTATKQKWARDGKFLTGHSGRPESGRLPPGQHLARHQLADLSLDTLPYNAHTTCSDALWAGLPVVTCYGAAFHARVAASLLKAMDLTELVTTRPGDYEALALDLAKNPALLKATRDKLQRNRTTAPLYDSERFRRNIEAAYEGMLA